MLGCNHPIWPSLGLIHGSRSSNDIKRTWERIETTARQNLSRNWQNGRFWWNDSDAIVLTGDLPDNEFQFHATAIYASGGMLLSGDDLTKISAEKLAMLRKLQPPTGVAARFEDDSFRVGRIDLRKASSVCGVELGRHAAEDLVSFERAAALRIFGRDAPHSGGRWIQVDDAAAFGTAVDLRLIFVFVLVNGHASKHSP